MNKFKLPGVIRRNQIRIVFVIGLLFVIITGAIFFMYSEDEVVNTTKTKKIVINNIANGVKAEDRWLNQAEEQIGGIEQRVGIAENSAKGIDAKIAELAKQNDTLMEELQAYKKENEDNKILIDSLTEKVSDSYGKKVENTINEGVHFPIQSKEIELIGGKDSGNTYKLEDYLPPGSYAKAVVTSGADVSVGVSSQSNPVPTLLRVIGKAKTAAVNGKVQEIDISGCTLTAAAVGDLSSERGYMRLLKMTCGVEEGFVRVTNVEGYVSGMGQAGVRGDVISREGDLVKQSFLAGVIGGLGKGSSQKLSGPLSFAGGFASTQDNSLKNILGSGLGKGVEDSTNNLSGYLIKRAEQYQSVISLPAEMEVEVVFSEGVYLDGRRSNEKGDKK